MIELTPLLYKGISEMPGFDIIQSQELLVLGVRNHAAVVRGGGPSHGNAGGLPKRCLRQFIFSCVCRHIQSLSLSAFQPNHNYRHPQLKMN